MHPLGYEALYLKGKAVFTGDLEKGMWADVPWTADFVDIEGDLKPKPRWRTRAKMRWSSQYFFVAAEMEEPHLWATLTQHDSVIFQDNDFEVFMDPDGDCCEYFEYEINALATDWDLFLPKPYKARGSADNSWEIPGLIKKVTLYGKLNDPASDDTKWVVEIGFPWAAFQNRLAPKVGEDWRVNFSRVEWDLEVKDGAYVKIPNRPEHNWVWSPQHEVDMHMPQHWGYVRFVHQITHAKLTDVDYETKVKLCSIFYKRSGETVPWTEQLNGWQVNQDCRLTKL